MTQSSVATSKLKKLPPLKHFEVFEKRCFLNLLQFDISIDFPVVC